MIADLSNRDLEENINPKLAGYRTIQELTSFDEGIASVIVLEGGKIVLDYHHNDPDQPQFLYSLTKGIMSLVFGKFLELEEDLTEDTTLGEIFDNDAWWALVHDTQEEIWRKGITVGADAAHEVLLCSICISPFNSHCPLQIRELLTMTSGLTADNPFAGTGVRVLKRTQPRRL